MLKGAMKVIMPSDVQVQKEQVPLNRHKKKQLNERGN